MVQCLICTEKMQYTQLMYSCPNCGFQYRCEDGDQDNSEYFNEIETTEELDKKRRVLEKA